VLSGIPATGNVTSPGPLVGPEHPYDQAEVLKSLLSALAPLRFHDRDKGRLRRACRFFVDALDTCRGRTLQERWIAFEQTVWPKWVATRVANHSAKRTRAGAWIAVMTRHVRADHNVGGQHACVGMDPTPTR
jgi:hypothetical protein